MKQIPNIILCASQNRIYCLNAAHTSGYCATQPMCPSVPYREYGHSPQVYTGYCLGTAVALEFILYV